MDCECITASGTVQRVTPQVPASPEITVALIALVEDLATALAEVLGMDRPGGHPCEDVELCPLEPCSELRRRTAAGVGRLGELVDRMEAAARGRRSRMDDFSIVWSGQQIVSPEHLSSIAREIGLEMERITGR